VRNIVVYADTDRGVMIKRDGGMTWRAINRHPQVRATYRLTQSSPQAGASHRDLEIDTSRGHLPRPGPARTNR